MRKEIIIAGAFDRYNYGDLLFPVIWDYCLKQYKEDDDIEIRYCGIRRYYAERFGGISTEALKNNNENHNSTYFINAGGNTLGAELQYLFIDNIDHMFVLFGVLLFRKIIGSVNFREIVSRITGIENTFPYVIDSPKCLYCAVGGDISTMKKEDREMLQKRLQRSEYISVRDQESFNAIASDKKRLTPDSAVLISDIWNRTYLEGCISPDVRRRAHEKYIVFQISFDYYKRYKDRIEQFLLKTVTEKKTKIWLVPIGVTRSHGDVTALKKIYKKDVNSFLFMKQLSIQEVTYIISNADYVIGSSLHANIVAFTYGVPSALIAGNNTKNRLYYDTWMEKSSCECVSIENIESIGFEMNECANLIKEHKKLIYENISAIKDVIFEDKHV